MCIQVQIFSSHFNHIHFFVYYHQKGNVLQSMQKGKVKNGSFYFFPILYLYFAAGFFSYLLGKNELTLLISHVMWLIKLQI